MKNVPLPDLRQRRCVSKKSKDFFEKSCGLLPALATLAQLQAEKCFSPRTCRGEKQI